MRYQKIHSQIWHDEKFRALSDDAKLLFLYLLSSPHSNLLGLYLIPTGYIISDLKWTLERFSKPFTELLRNGLISYDKTVEILLVKNHLKYNPIENSNQVTSAIKTIDSLPKSFIFQELKPLLEQLGKPFIKPLLERLGKPETETETEYIYIPEKISGDIDIQNEIEKPDKKPIIYEGDFETIWELYEKKGSKKTAYKVYKDLKLKKDIDAIVRHIPIYKQTTERQYRKDFERYLKAELWVDTIPNQPGSPEIFEKYPYKP